MLGHQHTSPTDTDNRELDNRIDAIPVVRDLPNVGEAAALMASQRFQANNPGAHEQLSILISALTNELAAELNRDSASGGDYILSPLELRGVIARTLHRTVASITVAVGDALLDAQTLETQLALPEAEALSMTNVLKPQTVPEGL